MSRLVSLQGKGFLSFYNIILFSECPCDLKGSRIDVCDVVDGHCHCNANVTGETCDRCEMGYRNFPNCEGI